MSSNIPSDPVERNGPLLVVITGPSGVGKDAVIERLKEIGPPCHVTVTATTRPKREGERHGVDYYFISPEEYDAMLAADEFLEHATVYGFGYGIPRGPLREALAAGEDVVVRIDVQGAATIGALVPGSIRIFLAPSSFDQLEQQLRQRNLDNPEVIERRLKTAHQELTRADECDYLVVNVDGRLDDTVCQIAAIINAERRRIHRQRVVL
ncbi:MAG: guanylate kinase [Dehalococcoidia bacterium]